MGWVVLDGEWCSLLLYEKAGLVVAALEECLGIAVAVLHTIPKFRGVNNHFIILMNSVPNSKFGKGMAGTACLCSTCLGHQLEGLNSWELESSGGIFTHMSHDWCWL